MEIVRRKASHMLNETQKKTAQAIVNIFETGTARGEYGNVTLLPGDTGHLTYGRSQTTLTSGNLFLLLKSYFEEPGALYAESLKDYLPRVAGKDLSLDGNAAFREILRHAGFDPIMHSVQDAFFDRVYWNPALLSATRMGITEALGAATVYDSVIHGSWKLVRDKTIQHFGDVAKTGEQAWIGHYIQTRRDWLLNHPKLVLHATAYRMDALEALIKKGAWNLALPLVVRGVSIDAGVLFGSATAEDPAERLLRLTVPHMQGEDVRVLQRAVAAKGANSLQIDGDFGSRTDSAVKAFQARNNLTVDGIVGPATRTMLEI